MSEAARGRLRGALRACKDRLTGDICLWDADAALRREMIDHLRLPMADGAGFVTSPEDLRRLRGPGGSGERLR